MVSQTSLKRSSVMDSRAASQPAAGNSELGPELNVVYLQFDAISWRFRLLVQRLRDDFVALHIFIRSKAGFGGHEKCFSLLQDVNRPNRNVNIV